jgi:hypothetical protein
VSIESRIDIVVKNLNQLNKLAANLQDINKTNEKLVEGLSKVNAKLDNLSGKSSRSFRNVARSASEASRSVSKLNKDVSVFDRFTRSGNNAAGRAIGLGALGTAAIGADKLAKSYNGLVAQNGLAVKALGLTAFKAKGLTGVFTGLGALLASYPQIAGGVAVALTALGIKGFDVLGRKAFNLGAKLRELQEVKPGFAKTTQELAVLNQQFGNAHIHAKNLEDALRRINSVGIKGNILRNVERSKASRAGSGFADFSRRANQVMNTPSGRPAGMAGPYRPGSEDAITKSIRRHYELESKRRGVVTRTWEMEKKIEEAKRKSSRITEKEGKRQQRTARERLANIKRIRAARGRGQENLMLGAGFPLLFGGGVGSVAGGVGGALLGNATGAGGFGMQILGSAIGTMMDTAIQKAAKLGEAIRDISMDDLVESGIRLTGQLQAQVALLIQAGNATKARALVAEQVRKQTGATAGTTLDIANAVNVLKAGWNDFTNSVGVTLGIIASPLIVALGAVLKVVSLLAAGFNTIAGALRGLVVNVAGVFGPGFAGFIDKAMNNLNIGLQDAIAKAEILNKKFDRTADRVFTEMTLKQQMALGGSYEDKMKNVGIERDIARIKFNADTRSEAAEILKNDENANLTTFNKRRTTEYQALMADFDIQIDKINYAAEQKLVDLKAETILTKNKIELGEREALIQAKIEKLVKSMGENKREDITTAVRALDAADKQLEKTKQLEETWKSIKDTIATGLTNAITGLIEGTKTLGQALSGILKQIGQILMQKALTSWIGGLNFGSGGVASGGTSAMVSADNAMYGNTFPAGSFSTGGMVTRPTLGLVGEAGEDEYIIPASKMASSMQRYSSGARGEAVIPGTSSSYAGGGGSSTTVNYSGPILNFNSEEFVPKSAVGQIIATATARGASVGESRTISSLRNSRSRRSSLGL